MLRRQARLRREYIYRKSIEQRQKTIEDKKTRLKQAIDGIQRERYIHYIINNFIFISIENRKIPTDLRDDALKFQSQTDWDDAGGEGLIDFY